jgi:hypothetical protein
MTDTRYLGHFAAAGLVSLALVALCFAAAALLGDGDKARASVSVWDASQRVDPHEYAQQLHTMRELHQRALTATTPQARESIAREIDPVMRAGVTMMLRMKPALPTSDEGVMRSGVITEPAIELVRDFMVLVDLLIEMKNDAEVVLNPGIHHGARPGAIPPASERRRFNDPTASQLVRLGTGTRQTESMA